MFLSSDTRITVAKDLTKPLSDVRVKDPVWVAQGPDLRSWAQKPANFFSKGETKDYKDIVFIDFNHPDAPGGKGSLVVDIAQVFLVSGQKFKTAKNLSFQDVLLSSQGNRCPIMNISYGLYHGAMYSIASEMKVPSSLADHLLLANGVVIADYCVCMFGQHLTG